MKKLLMIIGVAAVVGAVCVVGCTKENRDEALDRLSKAGRALNGELHPDDVEQSVPNIVAERQRKERIRQNTTWTADNRARHPVEYCLAQQELLEKYASRLEVSAHEIATRKAGVMRTLGENEGRLKSLERFLRDAKVSYRECEAKNSWPVQIGGFTLSREKVREKIVDATEKIPIVTARVRAQKNQLNQLEKRSEHVSKEQRNIVALRERIEETISDLKLRKVIDGEKGVIESLNVINDVMESLGAVNADPELDDILAVDHRSSVDADFERIMAQ